ncbi:transporter [Brucella endophytica]|uniref:Transporter n=1 Tax=Brucella endophytica TaxID=1963359 RepID=A0A916SDS0_9HYPH|nr:DMT family transporter [Brucella endophytica]GGA91775.1 transporter [Brucella endophytica]
MDRTAGWINGFLGVLIFSGSLPATKIAVLDIDPTFLTVARAAIAGVLAAMLLVLFRQRVPDRRELFSLCVVALGVVVGFPLLTALALTAMTSAHAIVFVGLLPLATALFAVVRGGERPRATFWAFSITGSAIVAAYALGQGSAASVMGDGLMLAAIIVCGLGYAEGARLSRKLGGWQVISWALTLSLPLMLPLALLTQPASWDGVGWPALGGLAYVSLFSMLVGFVFWYRGLAQGGTAAVGQLQLLQPFFGLALAAVVAHETVGWGMVATAAAVVVCVAGAKRFA